jgi:hypothetical protein
VPRPFIEFIQAQQLPWEAGLHGGGRGDVSVRRLSADEETGASSLLLRYPPGFRRDATEYLTVDEEFFVIAGDLTVNETAHRRYTYAHLPAGYPRRVVASEEGAVVLTFFSGEPRPTDGEPPAGLLDATRLVEFVDAFAGEWGGNFHPKFPAGAGRKWMRQDPHDGEQTWILGTMPLRSGRRPEKHPVVEEMYLLSGELVGHLGKMFAGAYFWRPPEEWHGPFGSPTGNVMLFRTKGGPLSTVYTEDERDFTWQPDHQPILPDELEQYGSEPWEPDCHAY